MGETECLLRFSGHSLRRPQLEAKVHIVRGNGRRGEKEFKFEFLASVCTRAERA